MYEGFWVDVLLTKEGRGFDRWVPNCEALDFTFYLISDYSYFSLLIISGFIRGKDLTQLFSLLWA